MKHVLLLLTLGSILGAVLTFSSCSESSEDPKPNVVLIHHSVVEKQVAFTALTTTATSWSWDFGDGTTSTERNPVHVYETGGYYTATLTANGPDGSGEDEVQLAIALTPYVLLTGGPTATEGKTWKLTAAHSPDDKLANADADFSVVDDTPVPLPTGVFDLFLGMGEVYTDEYTFHHDGSYSMDLKDDGASFSGAVYQVVTTGGAGIVNDGGFDFGLCVAKYTPESGATFTYVENEDLTVSSVYGPGGQITYEGVSTLDFSGTMFVGFNDFQQKVILEDISDNSMRLVMFMAAGQDPSIIGINTNALVLSFEVVN